MDGKLTSVLAPATRQLYWRGPVDIKVEVQNIEKEYEVARDKVSLLAYARSGKVGRGVIDAVLPIEVSAQHVGLLFIDGDLVKTLKTGIYVFWKFNRKIIVEHIDTRLQSMDVSGQEMLTKDRVSME